MTMLHYNRSLHPEDYAHPALLPHVEAVRDFERRYCAGQFFYRKDHEHREWEYANVLRQLRELLPDRAPEATRILDTGFGINYFTLMQKWLGYDVVANDSEDYGKVTEVFQMQCTKLGMRIPLVIAPVQRLGLDSNKWDVTMCISVIEHLHVEQFEDGLRELVRVTKPGGYIFITSDFFRNEDHALQSPSLGCQHSRFYEFNALNKIYDVVGAEISLVGGADYTPSDTDAVGLVYRGDFVNGHGFVNFCFQKNVEPVEGLVKEALADG